MTWPQVAVTVKLYLPLGVPGLPVPPPPAVPLPCRPPPQEMHNIISVPAASVRRMRREREGSNRNAATGNGSRNVAVNFRFALAVGAVVATFMAMVELPLPDPTCVGLKVQVVSGGRFEHVKVTLFGKLLVEGFTSTL